MPVAAVRGHVVIKQFTDPGGQGELGAAVAALPTGGAARSEQSGGIQAAQKGGLHAEQVRGGANGVGRVVGVVELVRGAALGSGHLVSGAWLLAVTSLCRDSGAYLSRRANAWKETTHDADAY